MTATKKGTSGKVEFEPPDSYATDTSSLGKGDSRTGSVYVFSDGVRLAVRVALATGRPLLVRGESGWGKSSLAAASARYLDWDFFETVTTSRTQARDLLWDVDLLLRLNDAQAQKLKSDFSYYIRPGVLWKAFQPAGAFAQQQLYDTGRGITTSPPVAAKPGVVVLIDEIDKADPDLPNNLLVTIGSLEFRVEETGRLIQADPKRTPLIFVTTNEERELPPAFLRRCVEVRLPALPNEDTDGKLRKKMLVDVVMAHQLTDGTQAVTRKFVEKVADQLIPSAADSGPVIIPSPAEFKDTILALVEHSGSSSVPEKDLQLIAQMTIAKRRTQSD